MRERCFYKQEGGAWRSMVGGAFHSRRLFLLSTYSIQTYSRTETPICLFFFSSKCSDSFGNKTDASNRRSPKQQRRKRSRVTLRSQQRSGVNSSTSKSIDNVHVRPIQQSYRGHDGVSSRAILLNRGYERMRERRNFSNKRGRGKGGGKKQGRRIRKRGKRVRPVERERGCKARGRARLQHSKMQLIVRL